LGDQAENLRVACTGFARLLVARREPTRMVSAAKGGSVMMSEPLTFLRQRCRSNPEVMEVSIRFIPESPDDGLPHHGRHEIVHVGKRGLSGIENHRQEHHIPQHGQVPTQKRFVHDLFQHPHGTRGEDRHPRHGDEGQDEFPGVGTKVGKEPRGDVTRRALGAGGFFNHPLVDGKFTNTAHILCLLFGQFSQTVFQTF
jgi:hypothetical protein